MECPVLARIDDVDSGAEHADGRLPVLERAAMSDGIDTASHPAHDHEIRANGRRDHHPAGGHAVAGVLPAADDGDCGLVEKPQVATAE